MILKFNDYLLLESVDVDTINLLNFIGKDKNVNTYLHTTKEEETAKNILNTGFQYFDFFKTTDEISLKDKATLDWNLTMRKPYGNFTIIIQFNRTYRSNIENLSSTKPFKNEDGEAIYTLPKEFIKGYFNRKTAQIVKNPHFNINYKKEEVFT